MEILDNNQILSLRLVGIRRFYCIITCGKIIQLDRIEVNTADKKSLRCENARQVVQKKNQWNLLRKCQERLPDILKNPSFLISIDEVPLFPAFSYFSHINDL